MNITKKERSTKITFDSTGEFTIPDYLPAVKKLLTTECFTSDNEPYIKESPSGGLLAELSGESAFRVTWIGEETGNIASAVFRCGYESSSPLGVGASNSPVCIAPTTTENVFCRATGPRKLSLRARLSCKLTVLSTETVKVPDALFSGKIERLNENIKTVSTLTGSSSDLFADAAFPPELEVLSACGNVAVSSCRTVSSNEAGVEGNIIISAVCKEDGKLCGREISVPFSETVSLSGDVTADPCHLSARGSVSSVTLNNDDSGYAVEAVFSVSVIAMCETKTTITRDAFSCVGKSDVEYSELKYLSSPASVCSSVTVSEKFPCKIPENSEILLCGGSAVIDSVTTENGKMQILGTLSGSFIVSGGSETGALPDTIPYSVPWKYEVSGNFPSSTENSERDFIGCAVPCAISARKSSVSAVDICAEISVSCISADESTISTVSAISVSGSDGENGGAYTVAVYFPEKGEGIWEIAKHFRVPTSRVAAKGNLNDDGTPKNIVVI